MGGSPIFMQIKTILGLENQQKIITRFGDIRSTLYDLLFPEARRRNNPSPLVKRGELYAPIQAIALNRRGDGPVRVDDMTLSAEAWEPMPINPYRSITGADLNNWRVWSNENREQYLARLIDLNRLTIRLTTEAMTAQVFSTGALDYPIMVDGKVDAHLKITFGTIPTVAPAKLWDANGADLGDVLSTLMDMGDQIQTSGYGSVVKFAAGRTAFFRLAKLITSATNDSRFQGTVNQNTINLSGYEIRLVSETYRHPGTGLPVKKVADNTIIGYADDAPHECVYSALDDLASGFIAVPFWSKPVENELGNEIRLISESKPLPVLYTHAIAKSVVTQ